jgi:hypothetical protein
MRKLKLRRRFTAVALIVLTAVGAAFVAPASANVAQGFLLGTGDAKDDWDDEGPLSMSENNHNNVVAMWQYVLWADGYLDEWSDIDCWFGQDTRDATHRWKNDHPGNGLGDNGIAGDGVFRLVGRGLTDVPNSNRFVFTGYTGHHINFWRGSDDIWTMSISGDIHKLAYGYANFDVCT